MFENGVLPAVYRRHDGGIWSSLDSRERTIRLAESRFWMGSYFADAGEIDTARSFLASSAYLIAASHVAFGVDARSEVQTPGSRCSVVNRMRGIIRRMVRRFRR